MSTFNADLLEELSTVLVEARIGCSWTQRQLAEALGMSGTTDPTLRSKRLLVGKPRPACDIANALGVTVAQRGELKPLAA